MKDDFIWLLLLVFAVWEITTDLARRDSDKRVYLLEERVEDLEGNRNG